MGIIKLDFVWLWVLQLDSVMFSKVKMATVAFLQL